ncbi:MAG TPA: hypothetical protein VMR52_05130 [Dehalococcoidia bacterium]|nr:hypothetical protein [Dehalococcoidia bacterium]
MRPIPSEDILITIGCEIESRPASAPGIDELAPFILSVDRTEEGIAVRFDGDARETLAAFVEAERQCCGSIDWSIADGPDVVLHIRAGEAALAVIGDLF